MDMHLRAKTLSLYQSKMVVVLINGSFSAEILDYRQRVLSIRDLVKQLPKPNHDTMQALFKHLRK